MTEPKIDQRTISQYGDHIKDQICQRLMAGESLNAICKDEGYPAESTVRTWVYEDKDKEFTANYKRAREIQTERFADELIAIADSDGLPERDRLRLETRKWILSKILPKTYSEKLQTSNSTSITVSVEYGSTPSLPSSVIDVEGIDIE